jgi:hypothetical protein
MLPAHVRLDKEAKADLVIQYTGSSLAHSTKDLSFEQANQMIADLDGKPLTTKSAMHYAQFDRYNRQHHVMLSVCYQLGWVTYNAKNNRNVPDLLKLSDWMQKYGFLKKPLMKYNVDELPKLITQFKKLLK